MKKVYILLPLVLLLASCGENSSPSVSSPSTQITPSVQPSSPSVSISESVDTSAQDIENELKVLDSSRYSTGIRDNITIKKDGIVYYDALTRVQYDATHSYQYYFFQETGINSTDVSSPTFNRTTEIYYDGEFSYSLDSDKMYVKSKEEKQISANYCDFDFTVIEDLTYSLNNQTHVLEGIIKAANVNKFLNDEGRQIEQITYKSKSNGTQLQSIDLTYQENGFEVIRSIEYSYLDLNIELPTTIYIK